MIIRNYTFIKSGVIFLPAHLLWHYDFSTQQSILKDCFDKKYINHASQRLIFKQKCPNQTSKKVYGEFKYWQQSQHNRRRSKASVNSGTPAESEPLVNNPVTTTPTSNSLNQSLNTSTTPTRNCPPPAQLRRPSYERTLY